MERAGRSRRWQESESSAVLQRSGVLCPLKGMRQHDSARGSHVPDRARVARRPPPAAKPGRIAEVCGSSGSRSPSLYLHRPGSAHPHLSPVVILRTPTDIFPNINIPVIAVAWQFTGLNPEEMEGRITTLRTGPHDHRRQHRTHRVDHRQRPGDGQDLSAAECEPRHGERAGDGGLADASCASCRPAPSRPLIINYSASTVPILQLALSGQGLSEQSSTTSASISCAPSS